MITVLFQTESHYPLDRKKVISAITEHLEKTMKGKVELGVSIVGDRRMRNLNRTYRSIDDTTDVLSFPLNDPAAQKTVSFVEPPDNTLRLGDIIISYPQAVLEAAAENKFVIDQVVFLALHGLNHLLGIHHPE